MDGNGGISLREQLHVLDGHLVGRSLETIANRTEAVCQLGRTQKVVSEGLFLPTKSGQRQARGEGYRTFLRLSALPDLFGDGRQGQQVVVVVGCLAAQKRLPTGSAHKKSAAVFQRVLQGVGFVGVRHDTGWEGKMPGFDCVVPMIDSNVPVFLILSLALLKNAGF